MKPPAHLLYSDAYMASTTWWCIYHLYQVHIHMFHTVMLGRIILVFGKTRGRYAQSPVNAGGFLKR